jgi:hypothetical protein
LLGRYAAVAKELVDLRVDGDHAVEHARLRIRIELNQDARLGHGGSSYRWRTSKSNAMTKSEARNPNE